jgi:hypothetical protein
MRDGKEWLPCWRRESCALVLGREWFMDSLDGSDLWWYVIVVEWFNGWWCSVDWKLWWMVIFYMVVVWIENCGEWLEVWRRKWRSHCFLVVVVTCLLAFVLPFCRQCYVCVCFVVSQVLIFFFPCQCNAQVYIWLWFRFRT